MFKRILTALLFAVLAVSARAEILQVNSPGDGYLNLRTGPGGKYAVIMRMYHGSHLDTLEYRGKWARVRHESGAVGWAHGDYMVRPSSGPVRLYVWSPGDGYLNLRTGPGTRYGIITRMNHGEWVEVLERRGNWARVYHEYGDQGWAYYPNLRR